MTIIKQAQPIRVAQIRLRSGLRALFLIPILITVLRSRDTNLLRDNHIEKKVRVDNNNSIPLQKNIIGESEVFARIANRIKANAKTRKMKAKIIFCRLAWLFAFRPSPIVPVTNDFTETPLIFCTVQTIENKTATKLIIYPLTKFCEPTRSIRKDVPTASNHQV